jgi:hypothetical protein
MTRGEQQRLFFLLFCQWGISIHRLGYEATFGEGYRTDEQAEINAMGPEGRASLVTYLRGRFSVLADKIKNNTGSGIRTSLHGDRLAQDVNLFHHGVYIEDGDSPQWHEVGKLWEQLHPLARWGGRWGDGNHLSLEFEGRK